MRAKEREGRGTGGSGKCKQGRQDEKRPSHTDSTAVGGGAGAGRVSWLRPLQHVISRSHLLHNQTWASASKARGFSASLRSCGPAHVCSPDCAQIKAALGFYGTPDGILGFLPTCLTLPMPQRVTATWIPLHSCLLSPKILHSSLFFISFSHLCASPSSSSCPVIWWEDHSSEIQQTWVSTAV